MRLAQFKVSSGRNASAACEKNILWMHCKDFMSLINTQANNRYFAIKCISRLQIFEKKAMEHVKRELKILRKLPSLRSRIPPLPCSVLTPYSDLISGSMQKQFFCPDVWSLARLTQHLHPHALRRGRRVAALDPRTRTKLSGRGCVHMRVNNDRSF